MTDKPQDTVPHRLGSRIPTPPDPRKRHAPLPVWEKNRGERDPQAPSRLDKIMASASYRRADQDTEFLEREEMRGIRLQLEYEKAPIHYASAESHDPVAKLIKRIKQGQVTLA